MKTLKEMVREIYSKIQLMEGREKGENSEIAGKVVTLIDYEFVKDKEKDKDYAVYIIKELPDAFFFAGMLLTEQLKQLDARGAKELIKNEGLPFRLIPKKSLKGRTYNSVEFYPNN